MRCWELFHVFISWMFVSYWLLKLHGTSERHFRRTKRYESIGRKLLSTNPVRLNTPFAQWAESFNKVDTELTFSRFSSQPRGNCKSWLHGLFSTSLHVRLEEQAMFPKLPYCSENTKTRFLVCAWRFVKTFRQQIVFTKTRWVSWESVNQTRWLSKMHQLPTLSDNLCELITLLWKKEAIVSVRSLFGPWQGFSLFTQRMGS